MLKFHMRVAFTALSGLAFGVASGQVAPDAGMLRWPDIGKDSICFVYANDIWIVPKEGGVASPLASPPGLESFPRFSPDETTIAFVGNYEGARDLYSIPVAGGIASRITHHPMGETLCDWTASGDLLFFGNGMSGLPRQSQMFSVGSTGGLPKRLPVPYSGFGSVSPDGKWLAYTPHSTDTRTWKRYRGGMATDIWLFNLENNTSKRITDWEGTDTLPMWVPGSDGKELLYLSDNGDEHRLNIWRYDIATGKRTQITKYTEFDVRWPSIGPGNRGRGEIVFQLGSELRVVDLAGGKDRVVKVTIPGDRPAIRPRSVDASKLIGGASISPSGKRVVVQGRGDLFSVPAKEGVTRNMTTSNGVFERDPSWSPDGKWIAYFSDETGEYELWVRASDAKPEEVKVDEKKSEHKPEDAPVPAAQVKSAPRKLTNLGPGFRYNPMWSPDSKWIVFLEKTGAIQLVNVESGELKTVAIDPWANLATVSWSHDSNWIAFDLAHPDNALLGVWIYSIETHTATKVISEMFSTSSPAFDAKGDWLFVKSNRAVNSPIYSDLDTTFVYTGTEVIGAIPLRNDVKNPWAVKSDEEMLKKSDESKKEDENKSETVQAEQAPAQGIEGTWSGTATGGEGWPAAGIPFTLIIKLEVDGTISGTSVSALGQGKFSGGTFNKESGEFSISITVGEATAEISGSINGDELNGKWFAGDAQGSVSAKRVKKTEESKDKAAEQEKSEKKKEPLKIEFDGFEKRMIVLPITPGSMGQMAATEDNKLIFVRRGSPRGGDAGIKIFDLSDDAKEEKSVTSGGGFSMSADRKKLLVGRGSGLVIADAAAGGGKIQSVPTDGMKVTVDPKAEWRQIFNDAWRLQRDFFYEPTLHHVDWEEMRKRYGSMIEDCATREDVAWVLAELISELNIGHAYVTSPGDVESSVPGVNVGLLGADYALVSEDGASAYQFAKIHTAAAWDSDARGPLDALGIKVKEGEYLLAVNGNPVDTSKDPWAAFIGAAGKVTSVTIGSKPRFDGSEREVLLTPMGSEADVRYRAWIESKRRYVEEKSGGRIGYIYVPNTGVDGQDDLFRQFYGQRHKEALIIDDRWNGGGQIPTRFIELLNRPLVNMWARRDGKDWVWPPDAHFGPKAMLINGLAGSGGDMFPALFRQMKLGKLIGTRTWGGLVGITGDPDLIDGGGISVPRFAYYEKDGTWGIEGHGVDPDIEVLDDPALMVDGGDPQIDRAVTELLNELVANPVVFPKRPASPDRSGMGIKPEDK